MLACLLGKVRYKPEKQSLLEERPQSKASDSKFSDSQYMEMSGRKSASSMTVPSVNTNRHSADSSTQTERSITRTERSITLRSVRTDSATNTHYENVENNEKPESTLEEKSESATETASGSKNSLILNISEDDLCDDTQTSQM